MQQKFLWGGAILVVLGAAVTFMSVDYARRHPDSVLARLAVATTFAGLNPNPLADVNRLFSGQEEEPCEPNAFSGIPELPRAIDEDEQEETIEPIQIEPLPQATVEPPIFDGIIDEEFGIEGGAQPTPFNRQTINPIDETPIPMVYIDETLIGPAKPDLSAIVNKIMRACGMAWFDLCWPQQYGVGSGDDEQEVSDEGPYVDIIPPVAITPEMIRQRQQEKTYHRNKKTTSFLEEQGQQLIDPPANAEGEEEQAEEEESEQLIDPPSHGWRYSSWRRQEMGGEEEQAEEEESQQLIDPPANEAGFQLVQFDVVIARVTPSAIRSMINAPAVGLDGTNFTNRPAVRIGSPDIKVSILNGNAAVSDLLDDMRLKNCIKIEASPKITTLTGRPTYFTLGGAQAIPRIVLNSWGNEVVSVDFRPYGVTIKFLPVVMENGNIFLEAEPEFSSLDPTDLFSAPIPYTDTRVFGSTSQKIQCCVLLQDGQTLAIGGMVGMHAKDGEAEEELLILITARQVYPGAQEEQAEEEESQELRDPGCTRGCRSGCGGYGEPQQQLPAGQINQFCPSSFWSGLTPAGTFTPDVGAPINIIRWSSWMQNAGEEEQAEEEQSEQLIDPPSYRGWQNRWWHWKETAGENEPNLNTAEQTLRQAYIKCKIRKLQYENGSLSITEYANARLHLDDCRAKCHGAAGLDVNSAARFFLGKMK